MNLSKLLKTKHFRLIAAVGEHQQLNLAAQHLAITQPAASRMLGEIESIVGSPLFNRHPKGMTPTLIGEALIKRSQRLLFEFSDLSREVEELLAGQRGMAKIGAISSAAIRCLVPAIQSLKQESPSVDCHLTVDVSKALFEGLTDGTFDFILARIPEDQSLTELHYQKACEEHTQLIVRAGHPLAQSNSVPLVQLSDYPWVIQAYRTPIRETVDNALVAAGGSALSNVMFTNSITTITAALSTSDAVAPLPKHVADFLTSPAYGAGFRLLETKERIDLSPYYLIQLKDRQLSPVAQTLKRLVQNQFDQ